MTTFKQFISEAFDNPYSYGWEEEGDNVADAWIAKFVTKAGNIIVVTISRESEDKEYNVAFYHQKKIGNKTLSTFNKTNEGDEFRIFATVLAIIKDFNEKVHPSRISFEADKVDYLKGEITTSRSRLYERMCRTLAAKLGFTFHVDKSHDHDVFLLFRK